MGRDGIVMATQDADSGAPSSSRDSLPGLPQAAELVRDAYGLPMQDVSPVGRTYRASPVSRGGVVSVGLAITSLVMFRYRVVLGLLCGIVSAGLGITDVVAYDILPGYVAYPGMAVGLLTLGLRRNAEKKMTGPETRGRRIALRAAGMLGMLGFLLLVAGTGHGDALNNAS
jgi:hypothetical protein